MPCLLALLALIFPRAMIVGLVVFSDYIGRAYQNDFWAVVGFFFAPYTTLAYAWGINTHGSIEGVYLAVLVLAVLADLGVIGGGERARRRKGRCEVLPR